MTWNQNPYGTNQNQYGPNQTEQFGPTGHSQYPAGPQQSPRPPRWGVIVSASAAGVAILVIAVVVAVVATGGSNSTSSAAASSVAAAVVNPKTMVPDDPAVEQILGLGYAQTYDDVTPKAYPRPTPAECVSTDYLANGEGFDGASTYSRGWESSSAFASVVAVVYPSTEAASAAKTVIEAELAECTSGTVMTASDKPLVTWEIGAKSVTSDPYVWKMAELTDANGDTVTNGWACYNRLEFDGNLAGYAWPCTADAVGARDAEELVDAMLETPGV